MTPSPLLDAHLHLQDKRFNDHTDHVMQRAEQSGVKRLFCNSVNEDDWQDVLALSKTYQTITPFIGVHPWYSDTVTDLWLKNLQRLLATNSCGVGEIGLDRPCGINFSQQKKIFLSQLTLAATFLRPVVIHCVNYWGACLDILEYFLSPSLPIPVMIHSYSGSLESMQRLVGLGCHLSFSAHLTMPGRERLQMIFKETPLTHILLETDAPDQLCSKTQTSTHLNEPAFIAELYREAARIKDITVDEFARQIWENGTIYTNQTTAGPE